MKIIKINDSKMSDTEIEKVKRKARAFLIQDDKVLVANYGGVWLLPGGSIEPDETKDEAIIRELKEETGIAYDLSELENVLTINFFEKDYPITSKMNINRLLVTDYYFGYYKGLDIFNTKRSNSEKKSNFSLKLVTYEELEALINEPNDNPRKEFFDRELKEVLSYLKSTITNEKTDSEALDISTLKLTKKDLD